MKKTLTLIIGLAVLALITGGQAQTLYWDGGTVNLSTNGDGISQGGAGTWNTSLQNWDEGAQPHVAWISGADASFGASGIAVGAGTVTLGAPITANSITVTTTNYIFTDGGNSANTLTINSVTNSQTLTISNNIVNSSGFTKVGGGTLTLQAASPGLTGPLTVNGGTLALGNNTTLPGATGFGSVTVASGATFKVGPISTTTYAQTISGGGSVSVAANSSSSTVYLFGNNTFTGSVTINQATLAVDSLSDSTPNSLGLGTNVIIGVGGSASIFTYASGSSGGDSTTRTLTLGGTTPTTQLNASSLYGPLIWLGPLTFNNTNKHTLGLAGTSTYVNVFGGTIPDNANVLSNTIVAKTGAGTWMLTGTNTYSGGTTFANNSGVLLISNDYALGVSNGPVVFIGTGTLKATNFNVTLGATRTVTVSNTFTGNFSVTDTNNFYVASFITGPGAVEKSGASFTLGVVRFSNDTNSYTGDFIASFGNTEFTSVGEQGTPSSLGEGAAATGGAITIANSTSFGALRYVGATNSVTHRALNWTTTKGSFALDVTNTGSIAYLNTTSNLISGVVSAAPTLTLTGSNPGTNTLAEVINDSPGSGLPTSLVKSSTGKWVLTGANTFSGPTTISGGTLSVSSDGNLGTAPGSVTPNSLTINGGTLAAAAGFTLNASRGIALGPTGTNSLGAPATGNGIIDVAAGQNLIYAGILADNTTTNSGGLIKTNAGTLTLSGASTYTGDTFINAGKLALSGSGSIGGTTNIIISPGATLDVSGVGGGYTLAAGQVLVATNGAVATINGSLNLGSAALVAGYSLGTPTITVTGGALTLAAANGVTVNISNGGSPLGAGNYKLISKGAGGSVTGTAPTSVTIGGDGVAMGATASLSISNAELYLVVSGGTYYPPVLSGLMTVNGAGAVMTFNGTNGQSWKILSSTNLTTPLTNWNVVSTGAFAGTPVYYTNAAPVDAQRFYIITSP